MVVPSGLKFKINLTILLTLLVTVAIYGVILFPFQMRRQAVVINQIQHNLRSVTQQYNQILANELFAGYLKAIKSTFADILKIEGIVYISTFDEQGRFFADSGDLPDQDLSDSELEALHTEVVFKEDIWNDLPVLTYLKPIKALGEQVGYLKVHYSLVEVQKETRNIIAIFFALLFTMLLFIHFALSFLLSRLVLKPVLVLKNAMKAVEDGKLGNQVHLKTRDEVGEMAEAFNQMTTELKRSSEELSEANSELENLNRTLESKVSQRTGELASKNDQLKELLHILCHDLSNPFANIQGVLDLDERDGKALDNMRELLTISADNGMKLIDLVRNIQALEEGKLDIESECLNLNDLINESKSILYQKLQNKNIAIEVDSADSTTVYVEKVSFINSVLNNIFSNAIKFSFPGSIIEVNGVEKNGQVTVTLKDFGIGMPDDLLKDIFDVSKTTHRQGTQSETGTGFGMPLVKKFVHAYQGRIEVFSKEKTHTSTNHGTTVQLTLKSGNS